ncbi:hypothetical protein HYR54_06755 [Candidatus Acetothermia bacterium]|nr:hypothetical protein [Candidatus Acetothermia bacterium]MBI3459431.1 hypothetical protein [Candidatus Acetothermia bacterium]
MKILKWMPTALIAAVVWMFVFVNWVDAQDTFSLPGDHYKWLLDSPVRPYLSSAAELYLLLKFGDRADLPDLGAEAHSLAGLNILVNDRSQDKNPSGTTQSETAVAVFGQNVVIGWNDAGHIAQTSSTTGYGYSNDGGQHFTDAGVLAPVNGGANLGDPDIAVDRQGNFYFSQISTDEKGIAFIGVSKSRDGGRTFSLPVDASRNVSNPDSFQDKEFIGVDATGGRFDGNVYVSWTRFTSDGSQIMFARSTNGGLSFEQAIALSPPGHLVQGSIPRVGPQGEVYVAWRDFNTPGIQISKSIDGGSSFGGDGVDHTLVAKVEFIGEQASPATCQGRRILNGFVDAGFEFPTLGINPRNGEVYLAYNSNPAGIDQSDIYFVRSSDDGHSWTEPLRVNDDTTSTDQWLPALAVAPDGTVAIIWYDRRNDPKNLSFDVYMAVSHDGGRTWLPNRRVTSVSSEVPPLSPNFDRFRPCYMGDYVHITASSENFYLAWGDNRDQGRTWKTLPDMLTPRESTATTSIGPYAFVLGGTQLGFREAGDSDLNEAYNTQTNRWVHFAPMPTPRSGAAAVSFSPYLYVIGGQSSKFGGVSGTFERYNLFLNSWVQLPSLPTPRTAFGAARIGNKIYAIGGQNCLSRRCGKTLDGVEVYDTRTGHWSPAAPLPEARADFATVVIHDQIYIIGGFNTQKNQAFDTILAYDPEMDTWTQVAKMPNKRVAPSAGVCGEKILIFDGLSANFSPLRRDAWLYDTLVDSWEQVAAPKFERVGVSAVAIQNLLYAIGGSRSSRVAHSGANEAFDCANQGFTRPDPDVYFAIESLSSWVSTSSVAGRGPVASTSAVPSVYVESKAAGWIAFHLESPDRVKSWELQIYDLRGKVIFDSGPISARALQWNLATASHRVANGVYLYWVQVKRVDDFSVRSEMKKLVVLRS